MEKNELVKSLVSESCHQLDQAMLKIENCLRQLNEDQVWFRPGGPQNPPMNSIGNLLLHLAGNLRQWGVVPFRAGEDRRQRELEFSADRTQTAAELLAGLRRVVADAQAEFAGLDDAELLGRRLIQGFEVTGVQAVMHTCSHFVGHAHQIIQLTRLQLGDAYQFQWTPDRRPDNNVPI